MAKEEKGVNQPIPTVHHTNYGRKLAPVQVFLGSSKTGLELRAGIASLVDKY